MSTRRFWWVSGVGGVALLALTAFALGRTAPDPWSTERAGYRITLTHTTTSDLAARLCPGGDPDCVQKAEATYGSSSHFVLEIAPSHGSEDVVYGGGQHGYRARLQHLTFGLYDRVLLYPANGDPVAPSAALLERTYGLAPSRRVSLTFPLTAREVGEGGRLDIEDLGLGTGPVSFDIGSLRP